MPILVLAVLKPVSKVEIFPSAVVISGTWDYNTAKEALGAPSTATTAKKCYYSDGPLNNYGLHNINCWQYFEGKTITELYGIVTVYDGDYSEAEIQVMLTRTEDIVLK